jgi:hypothetical protein
MSEQRELLAFIALGNATTDLEKLIKDFPKSNCLDIPFNIMATQKACFEVAQARIKFLEILSNLKEGFDEDTIEVKIMKECDVWVKDFEEIIKEAKNSEEIT